MSGQDGARGYLLQAMVCVLDSLTDESSWTSITIEPNDESDKVDVVWVFSDSRKAVQIKHSTNQIALADVKRWAAELEQSIKASSYELRLIGPVARKLRPKGGMFGRVKVPTPEPANLVTMRRHAAHNLDVYLTAASVSRPLRPKVRELLVDALSNRLATLSTNGTTFSRTDFDKTLRDWITEILAQNGCEPESPELSQKRFERLTRELANSHGRRVAGWQAAGLLRDAAITLSSNTSLGRLPDELLPTAESPLRLVVGPIGAGKSLAAERYFESCVQFSLVDPHGPIPVFIDALRMLDGLTNTIRNAADSLGDPSVSGCWFVIDGLDELPTRTAERLLHEARALVSAWPNSRALLTSRPMRCCSDIEERVAVPILEEADSFRLIALSSSLTESEVKRISWSWPTALKDAINSPLFAILLGKSLKEGQQPHRFSRAALIAYLVGSARSDLTNSDSVRTAFCSLATECLDRGSAVPANALHSRTIIDSLLSTGFVLESNGLFRFSLPIFTQWFAGQAIVDGIVSVESLWNYPGRVERWRAAIAIAVVTGNDERAQDILCSIAQRDPGFLTTVVDEATTHWGIDIGVSPPNAFEAARRIRNAIDACNVGIGKLASVIAPINPATGRLLTTVARTDGEWLIAGWNLQGGEDDVGLLPPQIQVPAPLKAGDKVLQHGDMLQFDYGFIPPCWMNVRGARPGRQPAWSWRWALEHLRATLKDRMLPGSIFDPCAQSLTAEAAWHSAIEILGLSWMHVEPIPLKSLEAVIPIAVEQLMHDSCALQRSFVDRGWKQIEITLLGLEWNRLQKAGGRELLPPLPTPDRLDDRGSRQSFPWKWYSETQTFARIKAVLQSALSAYCDIVREWFAPMQSRLDRAVTLPARLIVDIDMNSGRRGLASEPMHMICWEPLPKGASTEIVLRPAKLSFSSLSSEASYRLFNKVTQLRPEAAESINPLICISRSSEMFSEFAIRKLAYQWLEMDLGKIGWI